MSFETLTIDICSRGERGVLRERIDNIMVGPIRVTVGLLWIIVILEGFSIFIWKGWREINLGQDTIQPIQCPLRERHSERNRCKRVGVVRLSFPRKFLGEGPFFLKKFIEDI
jgi:hypothetical protein